MKKSLLLTLFSLFLGSAVVSAQINMDPLYSLETVTVDSFDGDGVYPDTGDAITWVVNASRATAPDFPKTVLANTWPKDKFGDQPDNAATLKALAVNGSFTRRGDNWLEIVPTRGGTQAPLPLTGEVLALGVWVWGSNYNYDLDVVVLDAEGIEHRLSLGNLNYMGWKNLTVAIPTRIKQLTRQFPNLRPLALSKFILTTNATEKVDDFYVYFDNITSFSQVSRWSTFDGSDLTQQTTLESIWGARPAATPAAAPATNNNGAPPSATSPEANPNIGVDNPAFQRLQEVSVSRMESPAFWRPMMSSDYGVVSIRSFPNAPANKQPIANEDPSTAGGDDTNVIGARIDFIRRGLSSFTLNSVRPIPVDGVVKVVSVWVAGRNAPHTLTLIVRDFDGKIRELPMGKLNFSGWKQMSVAIPSSIKQMDRTYAHRAGLSIEGFRVNFDINESVGSYFIYFDDVRALVDTYPLTDGREADDPEDNW